MISYENYDIIVAQGSRWRPRPAGRVRDSWAARRDLLRLSHWQSKSHRGWRLRPHWQAEGRMRKVRGPSLPARAECAAARRATDSGWQSIVQPRTRKAEHASATVTVGQRCLLHPLPCQHGTEAASRRRLGDSDRRYHYAISKVTNLRYRRTWILLSISMFHLLDIEHRTFDIVCWYRIRYRRPFSPSISKVMSQNIAQAASRLRRRAPRALDSCTLFLRNSTA